jgi:hypothetical protein
MYNEFVLTSKNYIRTVTAIRGDWLMELAPVYFDLSNFPEGESRRALENLSRKSQKKQDKKRKSDADKTVIDVAVHDGKKKRDKERNKRRFT